MISCGRIGHIRAIPIVKESVALTRSIRLHFTQREER
jgi:hypothetical protein